MMKFHSFDLHLDSYIIGYRMLNIWILLFDLYKYKYYHINDTKIIYHHISHFRSE